MNAVHFTPARARRLRQIVPDGQLNANRPSNPTDIETGFYVACGRNGDRLMYVSHRHGREFWLESVTHVGQPDEDVPVKRSSRAMLVGAASIGNERDEGRLVTAERFLEEEGRHRGQRLHKTLIYGGMDSQTERLEYASDVLGKRVSHFRLLSAEECEKVRRHDLQKGDVRHTDSGLVMDLYGQAA